MPVLCGLAGRAIHRSGACSWRRTSVTTSLHCARRWRGGEDTTPAAATMPSQPSASTQAVAPVEMKKWSAADKALLSIPYEVIDTEDKLRGAVAALQRAPSLALDLEAFCRTDDASHLGKLSLVQVCSGMLPTVYLFDLLTLTVPTFVQALRPLLHDPNLTKFTFDCRRDVEALSCQLQLTPRGAVDLQLYYTALQWRRRSVTRRSSLTYVLRDMAGLARKEGDSAVRTAMTVGKRPVWDVRPLPPHFLNYAADDVRHIMLLAPCLMRCDEEVPLESVRTLTQRYVEYYAKGRPVTQEVDASPREVNAAWLEECIGPGGVCAYCHAKGHTEQECFKKNHGVLRCSFCGEVGHTSRHCFRRAPQLLKCGLCGQIGHTSASCYKAHPCRHCGGRHDSANCLHKVDLNDEP